MDVIKITDLVFAISGFIFILGAALTLLYWLVLSTVLWTPIVIVYTQKELRKMKRKVKK